MTQNQDQFIHFVSHDLRTPLTTIKGYASMLEQQAGGTLNEKQAGFVDKILSGITQIATLIDNIQDAGRFDVETGFYKMRPTICDLREIVLRIVKQHLVPAEKGELTLSAEVADDVPLVILDRLMIERALTNLVDNAIKYTPNGGRVTVSAYRRDERVILRVEDNGYGISPENQGRLFRRYVRIARMEHRRVKGSGLGLFIVKSVAQHHGGDVWVESAEGAGSAFYLSLPLKSDTIAVG
jgi:signal transduction histidine kinase